MESICCPSSLSQLKVLKLSATSHDTDVTDEYIITFADALATKNILEELTLIEFNEWYYEVGCTCKVLV